MSTQSSAGRPVLSGVFSAALSGLVIFVVFVLIDHFFFTSRETARYGLGASLIGAGILGIAFGVIVGLVVAGSRSMPAGIVAGAVLIAAAKVAVVGMVGSVSVLAIIFGLIYGAIFGWCVASSAIKAMDTAG